MSLKQQRQIRELKQRLEARDELLDTQDDALCARAEQVFYARAAAAIAWGVTAIVVIKWLSVLAGLECAV